MSLPMSTQCRVETLPMTGLPISSSPVISQVQDSSSIDPLSATLESILAGMARFETKFEEQDRLLANLIAQPRPTPDPPYTTASTYHPSSNGPRFEPNNAISVAIPSLPQATYTPVSTGHPWRAPVSEFVTRPPPGFRPAGMTTAEFKTFGNSSGPTSSFGMRNPYSKSHTSLDTNHRHHTSWDPPGSRAYNEQLPYRQATAWDNPSTRQFIHGNQQELSQQFKMEPPQFDGSDAPSWIARIQYYFEHIMMPEEHRLHYVIMLFLPPASEWVFNYRANNPFAQWTKFLEDVRRRFDTKYFVNYIELIAKLTQTGSLAEYNKEFEGMMNHIQGLPESTLLPIYLGGLQQPVKNQVKFQHPTSVATAMALAAEFDSAIERQSNAASWGRHNWQPRDHNRSFPPATQSGATAQATRKHPQASQKYQDFSKLPVIKLTAAEKAERTRLGLCWYCPEKWITGHTCKGRFLAYMGADDEEDEVYQQTDDPVGSELITADLSHIYAMAGGSVPIRLSCGASFRSCKFEYWSTLEAPTTSCTLVSRRN